MKRAMEPDSFNLLIKYEKWVVCLLGLNLLFRIFIGRFYYPISIVSVLSWLLINNYLDNLMRTTKEHFKSSWCKNIVWWRVGIVFLQYIIAPIWMHLIAHNFNGKEEQKSTLLGYAITCDVLVGLIYAHLLITLLNK
ncbi:MAG: hypothetical protein MJ170_03995 [Alphaproteobacteria bacterium]|nr:hypothetical protein [Alphaproteobacteria bacterium]